MPQPSAWEPPEGFRKAGVLLRKEYHDKILVLAARTGKRPWQVIDQIIARGLEGVEVPPAVDLENLFRSKRKKK